MADEQKFSSNHSTEYVNIGNDLRFYADQQFKIVAVFMITTGFIANVAANHPSIGIIGLILSYLCLSWAQRTYQWWAILFEGAKQLEALAVDDGVMVSIYNQYPRKTPWPFIKASHAVKGIYYLSAIGWSAFIVFSMLKWR